MRAGDLEPVGCGPIEQALARRARGLRISQLTTKVPKRMKEPEPKRHAPTNPATAKI
jgi:hypothetical protein